MKLISPKIKRPFGFSLLELMTVLSIVVIFSAIGFSSFTFLSQQSLSDITNSELINAIQLTRAEAIARHEKMILCGSKDQLDCSPDWDKGYLIKTPNQIIYHFPAHAEGQHLHWRSFPVHKPQLEFLPTGSSNFQNGTFWFCATQSIRPSWAIILNKGSRVRRAAPDKDGILRDDRGVAFQC